MYQANENIKIIDKCVYTEKYKYKKMLIKPTNSGMGDTGQQFTLKSTTSYNLDL